MIHSKTIILLKFNIRKWKSLNLQTFCFYCNINNSDSTEKLLNRFYQLCHLTLSVQNPIDALPSKLLPDRPNAWKQVLHFLPHGKTQLLSQGRGLLQSKGGGFCTRHLRDHFRRWLSSYYVDDKRQAEGRVEILTADFSVRTFAVFWMRLSLKTSVFKWLNVVNCFRWIIINVYLWTFMDIYVVNY